MSNTSSSRRRQASHAGSWYSDDGEELDSQLSGWLDAVKPREDFPVKGCKAVIAPHAGYSYSGAAAAYAYKSIDVTGIKRVFILGPSHHVYLQGCALSGAQVYETPIGDLEIDSETVAKLRNTGKFSDFSLDDDEAEHSLEMHLPYVRKIFEGQDIKIVPIVVGSISQFVESHYGQIIAPYLAEPDTFCVVSSDFCHWGTRFSYTFYYPTLPSPSDDPSSYETGSSLSRSTRPSQVPIHESITVLDKQATDILTIPQSSTSPSSKSAQQAHDSFAHYLKRTKNTICGRHPIGVLLGALASFEEGRKVEVRFVRYEQSSQCVSVKDSSVSYASAWVRF
ncbi:UPF0103-domain-containing protein [Pterulicium gracile]|uniref:UPF0103-domain-containing protein n=1 Tax=Pterulicium gracile TaxID=1884261 RepID=A0A5C3QN76_9AGAR|nr:UPF0103-domain-containing protein [Pterula gracilis]